MKFEVVIERHYPHPISDVWDGLTTNEAISEWLMETTNFKAQAGHKFEMTCVDDAGHLDLYRCKVLRVDPPNYMLWSWILAGNEERGGQTEVEFRLTATDTGTRVQLLHRGDRDKELLERFKAGWPAKLDQLSDVLDRRHRDDPGE